MRSYKIYETGAVKKYVKTISAKSVADALRLFMLSDNHYKNDNLISAKLIREVK